MTPGTGPILAKAAGLYGKQVQGYQRKPVSQLQLTAMQTFSDIWGAENLLLMAEVGAVHVADLEPVQTIAYGRDAVYGSGVEGTAIACKNPALNKDYCRLDGYTTPWSWGYAARANLTYSNPLPGTVVTPSLAWRHDVKGYAPSPAPQFIEGRQAVTLAVNFDYQNRYNAALSYTDFFGATSTHRLTGTSSHSPLAPSSEEPRMFNHSATRHVLFALGLALSQPVLCAVSPELAAQLDLQLTPMGPNAPGMPTEAFLLGRRFQDIEHGPNAG